ncbi:MAG: site-specific DNA-methyltransferase [Syntrophales bacterium]|nr:site-specific DNA-methyltransferase [Syntrophales bacterium]
MNNRAKLFFADSRSMAELDDSSIDLIVTSPPYWHIKDYGVPGQIGHGQSLHQYLIDLHHTWVECYRVLREGTRLCINIGDQFARSSIYGRYKVIPLHAEFISQCEQIGFDFLGAIIWQKKTTMNTSGGANVMGSYPYPPNGLVEIDYEFVLIFKKPGKGRAVAKEIKEASKLTKEEWKEYYSGHWRFGGARKLGHEAMFPEELPKRLIRMFSFKGDTVLDPFLGSGTTMKVALEQGRNAVGYEINESFLELIQEKMGLKGKLPLYGDNQIIRRDKEIANPREIGYIPSIQDASPPLIDAEMEDRSSNLRKVSGIVDEKTIKLDTDQEVGFLGVKIARRDAALKYLHQKILGKKIILGYDAGVEADIAEKQEKIEAYVYLANRLFINGYLIKSGLGVPDQDIVHRLQDKFRKWEGKGD